LNAAREEHRTEFRELLALGGIAAAAWESRASAAKERADGLRGTAREAKKERERLENARAEITGNIKTAEAEQGEAQRKLDDRKNARERLRKKGTLGSDESPEDGKLRWGTELEETQAKHTKAGTDKTEAQRQLAAAQTALQTARTSRESKTHQLVGIRTEKRHIEEEHKNIGELQCVLDLCAGKAGDPRTETLLRNLEYQSDTIQTRLVRHQIETLEDTRTEKFLTQKGLAAPSHDLELTMEWLEREGVKGAMPA
jgi:chromosome segregation ATPase